MRLQAYARFGRDALRPGAMAPAVRAVRHKFWSSESAVGLGRDLEVAHTAPTATIPVTVRPMVGADVPAVLEAGERLSPEENWDRRYRRLLLDAGIGTPYVAVTDDDEACYVQWLFSSADNDAVADFFRGIFPRLEPGTALLEGAFTPSAHRGKKIMSAGMSLIAERAADLDARHVVTFVGVDNIPSLKGCARAGFHEEVARQLDVRLGHRRVSFDRLPTAVTRTVSRPETTTVVPEPRAAEAPSPVVG